MEVDLFMSCEIGERDTVVTGAMHCRKRDRVDCCNQPAVDPWVSARVHVYEYVRHRAFYN